MLTDSIKIYINNKNEKYIKALIRHFHSDEIGTILFFLPCKYLTYKTGSIDEDFGDYIPVIFGEVVGIFKKNSATFITVIDLNHKDKKKFSLYFKNKVKLIISIGLKYYFIGKISKKEEQICMFFPKYQINNFIPYVKPVYDKIIGCPQDKLHEILRAILKNLPTKYIFKTTKNNLNKYSINKILSMIHNIFYTNDTDKIKISWSLLKICEYTCFFDGIHKIQNANIGEPKLLKYKFDLPIQLTICQKKAIQSISQNLESIKPTISFVQGDVGSGKTFVAFCAFNKTLLNSFNSCFMAPTTILAQQHYSNYRKYFPHFNCFLIEAGYKNKIYLQALEEIYIKKIPTVFFGTHGLLFEKLENISCIVIDEQHKFGMKERKVLLDKFPKSDVIYLSATPIPRTLFLLKNQQMQLFTLTTMPFDRKITTTLIEDKTSIMDKIQELSKTEKILWINPMIYTNDSDNQKSAVVGTYEFLKKNNIEVYLLHGQLKDEEKINILNNFHKGVLVATTCVETGMDIENLNIIVIEDASQFGLATLHQLRGRVGRKGQLAECILIDDKQTERLNILLETNDGFKIAEMDLQQRGCGSFFQKQQWGFDSFKTGKFKENLFDMAGDIFHKKDYFEDVILELSRFFFKMQDVNY